MAPQRGVSCLRRVTIPVRVKRRWTHHLRRSLKVRVDSDGSIALAAIRHCRSFRGCANGAREYLQSPNMVRLGLCVLIVHSIKIGTSCIAPKGATTKAVAAANR